MPDNTSPRSLALSSLLSCEKCGRYTNLEIDSGLRNVSLSPADKGLYTRLVYGVIERRITLDHIIDRYAKTPTADMEPAVRMALRMGVYQLAFMDRIPSHAAVSETVDLVPRRSSGFVNAILRSFLRDNCKVQWPDESDTEYYLSVKYSFPPEICALYLEDYGRETTEKILAAFNEEPLIGIRVNTLRHTTEEAAVLLGDDAEPAAVPGMLTARTLTDAIRKGLEAGDWFVQDPASRLCTLALDAKPGDLVIDTCACPGGKSFSMGLDMAGDGTLYAFDLHENKLSLIRRTAERLGLDSLIHTAKRDARHPEETLLGKADKVLCDAPCSGLGVVAKKPDIRYKELSSIENLPAIQKDILTGAAAYVKPGGTLVYSTCTLRKAENEEVVNAFLAAHPDFTLTPFAAGGISGSGMLTLLPHLHGTDGFFVAKMTKKTNGSSDR
ncbi:MAG: 16S rRNA (cytosine(967)-C(5))-methyltransferase RsmB [Clostridia bacterium]|nr:16S rRNA (cytosine(967)-C(5))-methyltransferase RsmB [Clostridia bacterium]